jgi:hypothetical protein
MSDPLHIHLCPRPYCLTSWSHHDIKCTWGNEHICDRCSYERGGPNPTVTGDEWRLMHHLDIHTRQELENFLSTKDPDFLTQWIAKDAESSLIARIRRMEAELEETRLLLEDEQEYDDKNLRANVERIQKELGATEADDLQRDFLERELEICRKELAHRQMERIEQGKANKPQAEARVPAVEFSVQLSEFSEALKYLRPARARGRNAQANFVDVNVRDGEVEIVAPGVSFSFPAQVMRAGYARVPYLTFEWFNKAVKTLRQPSVEVEISQGQVNAANLTFSHPDISTRFIGPRIADLPIDAPLADVLALLVKFRPEELSDSGLLARVLAAQETASEVIDRAIKTLAPLEIKREALSEFIMEQIRKRSRGDR